MKQTADQEVAERIVARLRESKLLSDSALAKLGPKLTAGTLSADDWKLIVELDRPDKKKVYHFED